MPNYDASHYDPPAPVAQVTLRDPANGALLPNVLLLVDTGADITLLPWNGWVSNPSRARNIRSLVSMARQAWRRRSNWT